MTPPQTMAKLARWARTAGLERVLSQGYQSVLDQLNIPSEDERIVRALCTALHVRTMDRALGDPRADVTLARLASPAAVVRLRARLFEALRAHPDANGTEPDGEAAAPVTAASVGAAMRMWGKLEPAAEPIVPAAVASVAVVPATSAPEGIPRPPVDASSVKTWAAEHGVAEQLAARLSVLRSRFYGGGDMYLSPILGDPALSVEDALALPPRTDRMPEWERRVRVANSEALAAAARAYLHDVATARRAELARREAVALRAQAPTEPPLVALVAGLEAARVKLATRATQRPVGTYRPQTARVEEAPLRLVYVEGADFQLGLHQVRAVIAVEEEPLRVACDCREGLLAGACTHAFDAIDAALELLHDPRGESRKVAAILAVPVWQRFLHAFGQEMVRREAPPATDDARLVWRVLGEGLTMDVEPLIQKRLRNGTWSQGHRTRTDLLRQRRVLLADPRDARIVEALGTVPETTRSAGRLRLVRAFEAMIGHPRVFLDSGTGTPARVSRERLRVALEPSEAGVTVSFFVGARRYGAAELLALTDGTTPAVAVDPVANAVVVCSLDERAQALLAAFAMHPARFPQESHDDLLRGLAPLQESVELALPETLAGEDVAGDTRPVVRLSPNDSGEVDVDVLVRPVEGGPLLRPGEGPAAVLHAVDGRRVTARRDLAHELSAARVVTSLLPAAEVDAPWTFVLDEEATLDLLSALRDLGDAAVVEWPEPEKRLSLTATLSQKELRIRVTDRRDWFGVEGEVEVDGTSVPLAALLDAVRRGRRYVRVSAGRFAAIADDLRRRAAAADDVLHLGRKGLEVSLTGIASIEDLASGAGHLEAASRWRELTRRLDAARTLDPVLPEGLTATLRPYQTEGFRWLTRLAAWGAGACLADDMGLGKTVQALALLLSRAALGPALVIAPTSVGPNWLREAERFAGGLRVRLYRGPGRAALLAEVGPGDLLVTSYAVAVRDAEALGGVRFASLVLDEAQAIKNALTRRARAITSLSADLRVALTGTPVENHLGELWSLMRVLTPGLLGSWEHFRDRFAVPIERGKDPARRAALSRLLRPFLLRRTKAEVAPELPPRTEIERFVDLSPAERRLYDEARRAALEAIAKGAGDARFAIFAALTRLRRLACHPRLLDGDSTVPSSKLAALLEIVAELREEGHRALVFSQFTSHLALVREALERREISYTYLDGATPSEERTRRIDAFQAGETDLFLISLKAGGTGLNLTAADYVIHLDPWWNPAVEDQATDRAHRIGQTKAVTVIRLISRGTIEQAVLALHQDKRALAASVFDEEGSPARLSATELAALIRAGADELPSDDEGDSAGDEEVPSNREGAGAVNLLETKPAVLALPPAAAEAVAAPSAETLTDQVINYLAEQRGGVDPRYDTTLRTYARSLRRFSEYLARPGRGGAPREPTEAAIDAYLEAVSQGRWPVPASERATSKTVMNHVRAFLRRDGASPPGSARDG